MVPMVRIPFPFCWMVAPVRGPNSSLSPEKLLKQRMMVPILLLTKAVGLCLKLYLVLCTTEFAMVMVGRVTLALAKKYTAVV